MLPATESKILSWSFIITGTIIRKILIPITEPNPTSTLAMKFSRQRLNFSPSSRTIVETKYGEVMYIIIISKMRLMNVNRHIIITIDIKIIEAYPSR